MNTDVKVLENENVETYFKAKSKVYKGIKRTFDITCAIVGLIFISSCKRFNIEIRNSDESC